MHLPDFDEVHLWYGSLIQSKEQEYEFYSMLSKDEVNRAERFYFHKHRRRFIIARGFLRKILSAYLKIDPASIEFSYSENNKPFLANTDIKFNISHSHDLIILGFTLNNEIGVDVEKTENSFKQGVALRYFSDEEYAALMSLPDLEQTTAFYRIWAGKEAVIKAIGKGLYFPLKNFSVPIHGKMGSLNIDNQKWYLEFLDIDLQYQSAICTQQAVIIKKFDLEKNFKSLFWKDS